MNIRDTRIGHVEFEEALTLEIVVPTKQVKDTAFFGSGAIGGLNGFDDSPRPFKCPARNDEYRLN